jgi:hypothetical protein
LYQTSHSVSTGDVTVKPLRYGIGQIHGFSTEVNPGQAVLAFEVLDDVPAILGTADFRDPEELDQFLLCHDGWIRTESAAGVGRMVGG